MPDNSPIMTEREIRDRVPLSSTTRWRQEKQGRFPRRFQISTRKIGYHRADIEAWLVDPQGWRERQSASGAK
jgi:prophage regulatory protein